MEHTSVEDVEPFDHPTSEMEAARSLSAALGTTDVAINRYELAPGEGASGGYHAHLDQEEVFYVLSGTVTFQTEEGEVEVGAGEAIRFAPGEYQHGTNEGDERAVVLAIGAPGTQHDWEKIRVPMECRDCGAEAMGIDLQDGDLVLVCPDCSAEVET